MQIDVKLVRILYEFQIAFRIHTKSFTRNAYEIRTNFVRTSREFRPIWQ